MPDTIIQNGTFTSTGVAQTIVLRDGIDWMKVYNYTAFGATGANEAYEFWWQDGMPSGGGLMYQDAGLANGTIEPAQLAAPNGFTYVDTSIAVPGPAAALTGITAAIPPVVTSALAVQLGSIVRFSNLNHMFNIGGIDFTVTDLTNPGVSFEIGNISLNNATAATAGIATIIPYDAAYYPRRRTVTYVRNSTQAVIYLSVTHGFTIGQRITLEFPGGSRVWGAYAAMNGVDAIITGINVPRVNANDEPDSSAGTNNIQVNFNAASFPAWNMFGAGLNQDFPADNIYPVTPATVVPVGEDTATALGFNPLVVPQIASSNILADATYNTNYIGMILGLNATHPRLSPSGANNDVMYWVAGKSFATQP